MAEASFPIVEEPLSADQWRSVTLGIGNGILDEGGFPYRLKNLSNSTNTGVLQAASRQDGSTFSAAVLNGFYHRLDEDLTLEFPAVTSATTYHLVLQFDPTRTAMPVQVRVLTELDKTGGKNYLPLYELRREANQLLTDATVRHVRPRVAPVQVYASEADLPAANTVLWGTLALIHNGRAHGTGVLKMAITGDDAESVGGWFWKTIYDPNDNSFTWSERPSTASYTTPVAGGHTRAIGRRGRIRKLRGRVSLTSGNDFQAGSLYQPLSGDLSSGDRPGKVETFVCGVNGTNPPGFARIEIGPTGAVHAYVSRRSTWIDFAGVEWEVPE